MTWELPSSYGWAAPVPTDFDPEDDVKKALAAAVASVRASYPDLRIDPRAVSGHPAPSSSKPPRGRTFSWSAAGATGSSSAC